MKKWIGMLLCILLLTATAHAESAMDASVFTSRDLEQAPDLSNAVSIELNSNTALCTDEHVELAGNTLTITGEGIYLLSGSWTDGQIRIDAKDAKVQLVLNGVQLRSGSSAPIYVASADKVFVTVLGENDLENGGEFIAVDENEIDAVIFSKSDLTLNGSGCLRICSPAGHGIVSKDALTITGGSYVIDAAGHGISGKDSVAIAAGEFTITAGKDGIRTKDGGWLYLAGGSYLIQSGDEGISSGADLQIDGGTFHLTTGGGRDSGSMKPSDSFASWGGRRFAESASTDQEENNGKGIRAAGELRIMDGSFFLDCADDAVHGNGNVTISGGNWEIRTADDGIHAEEALAIEGGHFLISECYEGMEGKNVTILDGSIQITAADDGINASGTSGSSGAWGGPGRGDSEAFILIQGGDITIVSDGDCLDSNGSLTLNGGMLNLTCNGNGNTAIDYEFGYENNGANVTTNDGSESGNGIPGMGGFGGMGGRGDGQQPFGNFGQRPDGMGTPPDGMGTRPDGMGTPPNGNYR